MTTGTPHSVTRSDRTPWAPSLWVHLVLMTLLVPSSASIGPALVGHDPGGDWWVVLLAVIPVVGMADRIKMASYWALDRADRQRVLSTVRTGVASGNAATDRVALRRLRVMAAAAPGDRIGLLVAGLLGVVCPVVAAVRVSPWWLLTLYMVPIFAVEAYRRQHRPAIQDRLTWLEAATGP